MRRRISDLWFRLRAIVGRGRMERELEEEVAFHLEREIEKNLASGMTADRARGEALRSFGGVDRFKERARESWGVGLWDDLRRDLRFSLRQMLRTPVFTAVAVLTLGVGIGGTVALFSVVNGLMLRDLPFAEEERIVTFWSDYNWRGVEFDFVEEVTSVYEGVAAYSLEASTLWDGESSSVAVVGVGSAELFDVLGARPLLGRTFEPGEDRPGAEPVVVLSHGLWQGELGGDPDVIGRRIDLDGTPTTVVGVMPPGFFFPVPEIRAWRPLDLDPGSDDYANNGWLVLIGRLLPGAGEAAVQADLDRLTTALGERFTYPEAWDKTEGAFVVPLREYLLGDVRPALLLLLGAVGLLLVMACANVTALLLARVNDRRREIAVRGALGAGRGRLARQLLTEGVLLALVSGGVGAAVAAGLFDVLVSSLPLQGGFAQTLSLDSAFLAAAVLLSVSVGAVVALVPIRGLLRGRLDGVVGSGRTPGALGARGLGAQRGLVMAEVTLAVLLVTGAGLLIRSVSRLAAIDLGVDVRGVLAVDLVTGTTNMTAEERRLFYEEIVQRAASLPGVSAAATANRLPIRDGGWQGTVWVEDRLDLQGAGAPNALYRMVTPAYFRAFGIEVALGRSFEPGDRAGSLEVAMVNESFAREAWPGEDPVGKRLNTGFDGRTRWLTVVGVAEDVLHNGVRREAPRVVYRPLAQRADPGDGNTLVIRAASDPLALAGSLRGLVREIDQRVAVARVTTLEGAVRGSIAQPLRLRFFLGLFAALALVIGTVGVYGVVSYSVSRRTAEFGLRMALGAERGRVVTGVIRSGMAPVGLGVAAGLVVALALSEVLQRFLYEVSPTDPASLATAALVLLLVGAVAALFPAWRAGSLDPVRALRVE